MTSTGEAYPEFQKASNRAAKGLEIPPPVQLTAVFWTPKDWTVPLRDGRGHVTACRSPPVETIDGVAAPRDDAPMPPTIVRDVEVRTFLFEDDGDIPNHPSLPLLYYPRALDLSGADPAAAVESVFEASGWGGGWRNGVYSFPHYHAEAHEVLGVYRGSARIRLGGATGIEQLLEPGDVVVIPAGVGHENLGDTADFAVVGAYPPGQSPDLRRGLPEEHDWARDRIAAVPLPVSDPLYGREGILTRIWKP